MYLLQNIILFFAKDIIILLEVHEQGNTNWIRVFRRKCLAANKMTLRKAYERIFYVYVLTY